MPAINVMNWTPEEQAAWKRAIARQPLKPLTIRERLSLADSFFPQIKLVRQARRITRIVHVGERGASVSPCEVEGGAVPYDAIPDSWQCLFDK